MLKKEASDEKIGSESIFMDMKKDTLLVVDDTPENLTLMAGILRDAYRVKVATTGEKAITIAKNEPHPDLILLDIMMPELDGYEICRRLKSQPETRDIPVIFLTALSEIKDEKQGLEAGAVDYITKPISPPILMARVRNHLKLKAAADFLRDKNSYLEAEVDRRTHQVRAVQEVTILALASLAETRDNDTGNHLKRTQEYIKCLALRLTAREQFSSRLTDSYLSMIIKSAPLHDIGKVGIPDSILLKPSSLTPEEFEIMKTHTILGRMAIENAEKSLGYQVDFLRVAKEIALSHHERWDGTGYPAQLAAEEIPLSARLMAVADVYDSLISQRVYKSAMLHEEARSIVVDQRETQFDPLIIDAFIDCAEEFRMIADRYIDSGKERGG
jgi:putative two-component system response regulator